MMKLSESNDNAYNDRRIIDIETQLKCQTLNRNVTYNRLCVSGWFVIHFDMRYGI